MLFHLQQVVSTMTAYLSALSCWYVIGWLYICINQQLYMCLIVTRKFIASLWREQSFVSVTIIRSDLFFLSPPQTHSPRVNPESWAWPWFPVTTWCPSRWRQTVWRRRRDLALITDEAPSVWTALGTRVTDSRWARCKTVLDPKGEQTSSIAQTNWMQNSCVDVLDLVNPVTPDGRVHLQRLLYSTASVEVVCVRSCG